MIHRWFIRMGTLVLLSASTLWAASTLNVQVKNGQIRATPSFLGKVLQTIGYGSTVEVLQTRTDWIQVKPAKGQVGWMHKSALTTKRITVSTSSNTAKAGASSDELALAGKGFNAQVEKEYKAKNKKLDFEAVNRMEKVKVSPEEMQTFLEQGSVKPAEGGVQ